MKKETPPVNPALTELSDAGYFILQVPIRISGKKRLELIGDSLRKPNALKPKRTGLYKQAEENQGIIQPFDASVENNTSPEPGTGTMRGE